VARSPFSRSKDSHLVGWLGFTAVDVHTPLLRPALTADELGWSLVYVRRCDPPAFQVRS
jgi:hypothetical protein